HRGPGSEKIELDKRFISRPGGVPMQTECNADLFGFARVEGRAVVAAFDGGALVQIAVTSKNAFPLRHGDFKPRAPHSRPQAQLGPERPDVPVRTVPSGCDAVVRCRRL